MMVYCEFFVAAWSHQQLQSSSPSMSAFSFSGVVFTNSD